MPIEQVFSLIKAYAMEMGQPGDMMVEVLTSVSDEHSIPLKVYSGNMDLAAQPRQVIDPLSISVENFMGVGRRVIDIEPGVTLLYGPNGSGKTTAMRAMLYALFGGPAAGVKVAESLIHEGQSQMGVEFKFSGGHVARSCERRVIKKGAKAGQTEVDHGLAVQIAGDKANKAKEAQGLIDGWLGVDAAFVRRVCCLEQGMLTEVMNEQPARRREMFYKMLALEPCEDTRKALAVALTAEESRRGTQKQELEAIAAEIEKLQHQRAAYEMNKLTAARDQLAPVAASTQVNPHELKQAQEALARRELDLVNAERQGKQRKIYMAQIDELKRDPSLNAIREDLAVQVAAAERDLNTARGNYIKTDLELKGLTKQGEEVKALPNVCPTCAVIGKVCEVTPDIKEKVLMSIRTSWTEKSKALARVKELGVSLGEKLAQVKAKAKESEKDQQRKAYVVEQLRMLQEALDQMAIGGSMADLATIEQDIQLLTEAVALKQSAGNPAVVADLRVIEKSISEAITLDMMVDSLQKKMDEMNAKPLMGLPHLEAFRFAVAAFAKDGLPLWLARQHLDRVNAIAAELCTLDRYEYKFGSDLEVQIYEVKDSLVRRLPELTCGSARERGAVVLMAALGRYLQELTGLQIPLLWIDELPFQDEANAHLVVDMVRRLTQWYPKVVLCASRWEEYLEQFDHEIALMPEDVAIELDRQRQAKDKAAVPKHLRTKVPPVSLVNEITLQKEAPTLPKAARPYIALCETHEKGVDGELVNIIRCKPLQCHECAKNGGRQPEPLPTPAPAPDVMREAQEALDSVQKMDEDLEGDCPF